MPARNPADPDPNPDETPAPIPPSERSERLTTRCCIAGGGPAGMMLGFLLARAGVDVVVLEKHADFLRDFRGDTLHPSTLELMHELGLLDDLLREPHQKVSRIGGFFSRRFYPIADFSHLPTRCQYIAFMPQWDFLNFLAEKAKRYPTFHLRMESEVSDLIRKDGKMAGLRARTPEGELEVRAELVIGADGRGSTVRERVELRVTDFGAPIDVLWFRLSKKGSDPEQSFGYIGQGQMMVLLDRGDYWQCGLIIPKGGFAAIRERGLEPFRESVGRLAPFLEGRLDELGSWEVIRLLTVKVDRLAQWHRPGLLCIGDAAHAMSPVGGVGINLAIQDAVAAANLLCDPLRHGTLSEQDLEKVQRRREFPTRMTQRVQIFLHRRFLSRVFEEKKPMAPPCLVRLLARFPLLRRIPARLIGIGFRAEHIGTGAVGAEGR